MSEQTVKIQAETFVRLCAGQIRDARPVPEAADPEAYYLGVLADKTGVLIATAARYGAMFSGWGIRTLADGDLLSLDLAVSLSGVVADSAISFVVGDSQPPDSLAMIAATERALAAGIAALWSPTVAVVVAGGLSVGSALAFTATGPSRAWRGTPHDVGWLGPLGAPGMRTVFGALVAFGGGREHS